MKNFPSIGWSLLLGFIGVMPAWAIEPQPTAEAITLALSEGKAAATQPFKVRNQFGTPGYCGWGFIQTKLLDLYDSAREASRKFQEITIQDQQKILQQPNVLVWYVLCTDSSAPGAIHLVIKQGETVIQPAKVSPPEVQTTPRWPDTPAYSATVFAEFSYAAIPLKGQASIVVVPPVGERIEYPMNLTEYP